MKSIEDRLEALGLTTKPKQASKDYSKMDRQILKGIALNRKNRPETREKALTELESRKKSKV